MREKNILEFIIDCFLGAGIVFGGILGAYFLVRALILGYYKSDMSALTLGVGCIFIIIAVISVVGKCPMLYFGKSKKSE